MPIYRDQPNPEPAAEKKPCPRVPHLKTVAGGTNPGVLEAKTSLDLPLCQTCGGRCCQGSPGIWVDPERFFAIFFQGQHLPIEQLRKRLPDLGMVLWEKTGVPIPAPQSLTAGCAFLGVNGCLFSISERPCQCLALIPNKETLDQQSGCLCSLSKEYSQDAANQRWRDYWQTV